MADMEIVITGTGIEDALRRLEPKNIDRAIINWYDRGLRLVKNEMRSRTASRIRGKVVSRTDGYSPPRWAQVKVKSPLAHLLEGGTGRLGDPTFKHNPSFFPSVTGIMRQTGLEKPQAFVLARAIAEQGGMRPKPFVRPTFEATAGPLLKLMETCVDEALK
jgi:hypothetical protein